MCRDLKPVLAIIARHDKDLERQVRRAACSVVLNIAEGEHSSDGHRRERFRTAMGRTVLGGGGITPDIEVKSDSLAPAASSPRSVAA